MADSNGNNGTGRQSNGRFAKGNPGGPGNPNHRRVHALRAAFLSAFTEEKMIELGEAILRDAIAGDPVARKLACAYAMNRPQGRELEAEQDTDGEDEWEIIRGPEGDLRPGKRSSEDSN